MARRTLEAMMLDAAPSTDSRDHRVVASVLAYLSESIIRSDHILLLCDTPLGATHEELDGLIALSGRWDPPLWKHPGPDIFEAIRSAGVPLTARGVWTVEEVLDYAVDLIREVVPELSDETIERIATECAYAVDDALVGGDRVDWSPRAPERAVEEWTLPTSTRSLTDVTSRRWRSTSRKSSSPTGVVPTSCVGRQRTARTSSPTLG